MASALDAVLQLKSQEAAQAQQQSDNLTQGLQMLQNARQQAISNQMAQLQYKAGLAEKGLVPDSSTASGFRFDASTMNPFQQILTGTKLQADAKTAGNKQIYDLAGKMLGSLPGQQQNIPQSPSIDPTSPVGQAISSPQTSGVPISTNTINPVVSQPSDMTPTGQTSSTDPITGQTTGTTTSTNIPGKTSEAMATKMGDEQAVANQSAIRDNVQMQSVGETLKNLNDLHSQLSDRGIAGTDLGSLNDNMNHIGTVARVLGMKPSDLQNRILNPDDQRLIGQFTAARNEGITRAIQPLQNQLGKDGSNRISESLMRLTQNEYGGITDTHPTFQGKLIGTGQTLFRIGLASQQYAQDLKDGKVMKPSSPEEGAKEIYSRMGDLNPTQEKEMKSYVDNILNNKSNNSSISQDLYKNLGLDPKKVTILKKVN